MSLSDRETTEGFHFTSTSAVETIAITVTEGSATQFAQLATKSERFSDTVVPREIQIPDEPRPRNHSTGWANPKLGLTSSTRTSTVSPSSTPETKSV